MFNIYTFHLAVALGFVAFELIKTYRQHKRAQSTVGFIVNVTEYNNRRREIVFTGIILAIPYLALIVLVLGSLVRAGKKQEEEALKILETLRSHSVRKAA